MILARKSLCLNWYAAKTNTAAPFDSQVANGNYTAGFIVLSGEDPTKILQRSGGLLVPSFDYETLCEGNDVCAFHGERKNVIFASSATLIPPRNAEDSFDEFRLFFGGGDGNVGTAIIRVSQQEKWL